MTKTCIACKAKLKIDRFYLSGRPGKKYRENKCIKCRNIQRIERRRPTRNIGRKIQFSNDWFRSRFDHTRAGARTRGKEFSLSREDFKNIKTATKCFYCGIKGNNFSIDRVDNTKGYMKDNCVPACFKCNKLKGTQTLADLKNFIKKINKFNRDLTA